MSGYLGMANSLPLYLVVSAILLFIAAVCLIFIIRSYRAGLRIGMDRKVLNKAITSSAMFTILPSISILLGVIALSGSLGVPISWLRLSVIGNLQYEATVASIAAESMGLALDSSVLDMNALVTIMLVMTMGIIWGCVLSIFTLKAYSKKISSKSPDVEKKSGPSFASWAMVAMFIGLCATFLGSYVGRLCVYGEAVPVLTAVSAAAVSAVFDYLVRKKGMTGLESFSLALSMLFAMACAVVLDILI